MRSVLTIPSSTVLNHPCRHQQPPSSTTAKIPSLRYYSVTIPSQAHPSLTPPPTGAPIRRTAAGRPPPRLKREDATLNDAWLQGKMLESEQRQQGGNGGASDQKMADMSVRDTGLATK